MNYRFIGLGARFYPDIRDLEGKSLMAEDGTVFDFEGLPPSDGLWVPAEDEPSEAGPVEVVDPAPAAPETVQEAPEPAPVPEPPAASPEPVQQAPEPAPAPVAPQPSPFPVSPAAFSFPGFAPATQPYTR